MESTDLPGDDQARVPRGDLERAVPVCRAWINHLRARVAGVVLALAVLASAEADRTIVEVARGSVATDERVAARASWSAWARDVRA